MCSSGHGRAKLAASVTQGKRGGAGGKVPARPSGSAFLSARGHIHHVTPAFTFKIL